MISWSVVVILLLLLCLIALTYRLRLELDDEPLLTIFFVWWPVTFYLGWIMVATIACVSAWLVSIDWQGWILSKPTWTVLLIIIASFLYLLLIARRNMREAAIVGAWAFIAIAVRQWEAHISIAFTAIIASLVLLLACTLHAYKNRRYNIGKKLADGEW